MAEDQEFPGEETVVPQVRILTDQFFFEPIFDNVLSFQEASRCLNTLGKDESAVRYAYLMLTATDRKLTDISVIVNFTHLQFVDVSGNYLTLDTLQVVTQLPYILYLKAKRNRAESAGFNLMNFLQVLILSKNLVRETGDIGQPYLETLDLSHNLIYTLQFNPERLGSLKELNLTANHLLDTAGTYPVNVERLFMGQNKISKINGGLLQLRHLKFLHLRENFIKKLSGFNANLENLTYLNLRDNKINKMRQLRKLNCLPKLETLIVLDNPFYGKSTKIIKRNIEVEKGEDTDITTDESITEVTEMYAEDDEVKTPPKNQVDVKRVRILALLPNLKRINKDFVTLDEREVVDSTRQALLDEILQEDSSEDDTDAPTTTGYTTDYSTETDGAGELERSEIKLEPKTVEFAGVDQDGLNG